MGFYLGFPTKRRVKLLRKWGILNQQEAQLGIIVENNDGVPSVLTNFRGCRKSTVCNRYAARSWLIGRMCVYISNDPEQKDVITQRFIGQPTLLFSALTAILGGVSVVLLPRFPKLSLFVSAPVALALGFFAPMCYKRGVAIFDDITLDVPKADGASKTAPYTDIPFVANAEYKGRSYRGWIQVVVSSNEGIRPLQRDPIFTKYGYCPFPTPLAEELRDAVKEYICNGIDERKKDVIGKKLNAGAIDTSEDFPPPTEDEIEQAVERYGEWWGYSISFWTLPFTENDVGFYKRMRSATLSASDVGKLAAVLDLSCNSGPAPLTYSPPIDVSEFNEAFMAIGGKGLLEDAVRDLYGNNRVVDVHCFPRRLLHSVMYSLVSAKPITGFTDKIGEKLAETIKRRAVPLTKEDWELSEALLSPLGRGMAKR